MYVHVCVTSNSSCYISSLQDRSKNTRFLRYGKNAGNQEGKSTIDNFHHYGLRSKLRALIGADAALWREGKTSLSRDDLTGSKGGNSNSDSYSCSAVGIEVEKEVEEKVERGGEEKIRCDTEIENKKENDNDDRMYEEIKGRNDKEGSDREGGSDRDGSDRGGGDKKSKHQERGTWGLKEVEQGSVEDSDTDHPYGWNEDLDQYGQVRYHLLRF